MRSLRALTVACILSMGAVLFIASPASAATLTVCASGCDSTTTFTAAAVGPDEVRVIIDRADFPGAPASGSNLHFNRAMVLGEPIPVAITVTAAVAPLITSPSPTTPVMSSAYSFQVTASGDPAPTFAITGGALPTGLSMSASGLITGTPTATGAFTFTVTASNGTGPDATATYTLNTFGAELAATGTSTAPAIALGGILILLLGIGITVTSRSRFFTNLGH